MIHPIRMPYKWDWEKHGGTYDYSDSVLGRKRSDRARRDITSYEQQRGQRDPVFWGKLQDRRQRRRDREAGIERSLQREAKRADPLTKFAGLIRKSGKQRGEINLIPYGQFRKTTGIDPSRYQRATVTRAGRKYIRWDRGGIDEIAQSMGFSNDQEFVTAVERAARRNPRKARKIY